MDMSKPHFNQTSTNQAVQTLINHYNCAYKSHITCKASNTKLDITPQPPHARGWEEVRWLTDIAKRANSLLGATQRDQTLISLAEHVIETTKGIISEFHSTYWSQSYLYTAGWGLSRKQTSLMKKALSAITTLFKTLHPDIKIKRAPQSLEKSTEELTAGSIYSLKINIEQLHDKLPFRFGIISDLFDAITDAFSEEPKDFFEEEKERKLNQQIEAIQRKNQAKSSYAYTLDSSTHTRKPVYGLKTQYCSSARGPRPVRGIVGYW